MAFKITDDDFKNVWGKNNTQPRNSMQSANSNMPFTVTDDDLRSFYSTKLPKSQPVYTQTAGVNSPAVSYIDETEKETAQPTVTAKEKYGNTLYVPASMYDVENERRNKLNYIVNENYRLTSGAGMANPYAQLEYVNEAERLAIADYVVKKDYDSAYKYLQGIEKELNKRQAESEYKQVTAFAEKYPASAIVTNVLNTPFKVAEYGVNVADYIDNKLADRQTDFDSNSPAFSTSRFSEAVNETVMRDSSPLQQIMKSAAMSAVNQYGVSKLVGKGPLTELLLAGRSAQDSLYQNAKRNVSGGKALVNSVGNAGINYLSERYFPSEKLFGLSKVNTPQAIFAEGVESAAENVVSNLWDTIQLKDESSFSQLVQNYKNNGYTVQSATAQAIKDIYARESMKNFLVGAASAGLIRYGIDGANEIARYNSDADNLGVVYKAYARELDKQIKKSLSENNTGDNSNTAEYIDLYTENDYTTNSAWIRENNLVTTREYEDFCSKVMSINTGIHFEKTDNDLYIIPTGDEYGVNNTLIFTDGNSVNPSVERIVKINLDNETAIDDVRRFIYGQEVSEWNFTSEIAGYYFREGIIQEYTKSDCSNIHPTSGGSKGRTRQENTGDNQQQRNGAGNFRESEPALTGYKGENRHRYYNERDNGYFVELVDGQRKRFYVPIKNSKDKHYMVIGRKYKTIEALVKAENNKILRKINKSTKSK